ncbi:MAG: 1-acyl-sn-glycerol-3-phosphate acyltransferase [Caldilineaceae bacterium]|nr:1-acyl-sn-glycerol-3-phosphate acyltransferase [Caldilineaceae bacterium]
MPSSLPEQKPRTWSQHIWYFFFRRILGWRVLGNIPAESKYVIIVAPHTSNLDFFIGFIASRAIPLPFPNFAAKHTVFVGPIGALLKKLGGIPINRTKNHNVVDQIIDAFKERDHMIMAITPEGTRSKVQYWRSGFYHIAVGADAPIVMVAFDYEHRQIVLAPPFTPCGDPQVDMARIQEFYSEIQGRHPERQGPIGIRPAYLEGKQNMPAQPARN